MEKVIMTASWLIIGWFDWYWLVGSKTSINNNSLWLMTWLWSSMIHCGIIRNPHTDLTTAQFWLLQVPPMMSMSWVDVWTKQFCNAQALNKCVNILPAWHWYLTGWQLKELIGVYNQELWIQELWHPLIIIGKFHIRDMRHQGCITQTQASPKYTNINPQRKGVSAMLASIWSILYKPCMFLSEWLAS